MSVPNNRSILELTTTANYVKMVEAMNRLKEMKPLVTIPTGIVLNPVYRNY